MTPTDDQMRAAWRELDVHGNWGTFDDAKAAPPEAQPAALHLALARGLARRRAARTQVSQAAAPVRFDWKRRAAGERDDDQ